MTVTESLTRKPVSIRGTEESKPAVLEWTAAPQMLAVAAAAAQQEEEVANNSRQPGPQLKGLNESRQALLFFLGTREGTAEIAINRWEDSSLILHGSPGDSMRCGYPPLLGNKLKQRRGCPARPELEGTAPCVHFTPPSPNRLIGVIGWARNPMARTMTAMRCCTETWNGMEKLLRFLPCTQ